MNRKRYVIVTDILSRHANQLLVFSVLMLVTYYVTLSLYKAMPISIAYPIVQSASVFSVLIGTYIFEGNTHVGRKLFAAIVAVVGVLIIQLV